MGSLRAHVFQKDYKFLLKHSPAGLQAWIVWLMWMIQGHQGNRMELFSTLLVGVCSWFPTARTCSSFSEVYHKVVAERFRVENRWFPSCITHHLQQSHTLAWLLPLFLCYLLHSLLKNTYLFIYLTGRRGTDREGGGYSVRDLSPAAFVQMQQVQMQQPVLEPGWSQEPGILSRSPIWMARTQLLGSSFTPCLGT